MKSPFLHGRAAMRIAARVFRYHRPRYTVGTLGDAQYPGLTCSEYVAWSLFGRKQTVGFVSFEAAYSAVLEGKTAALFVPGAYRRVDAFIQSDRIHVVDYYEKQIPPLVVAGTLPAQPTEVEDLFIQMATESMIPEVAIGRVNHVSSVVSNVAACLAVMERGRQTCCITNKLCAEHFGLKTYQVLRPSQTMPFYLFELNK
jgi:hypothetical protein